MGYVGEVLRDFFLHTSFHGLKLILISRNRYEKFFWISIMICSLVCSGYLTELFWGRYMMNPTRTVIQTSYAPPDTVPFPAVTVCNINDALLFEIKKFVAKLDGTKKELELTQKVLLKQIVTELVPQNPNQYNTTELDIVQNVLSNNDFSDYKRILKRISQPCSDLLVKCSWNGIPKRCSEIFEENYSTSSRCCSFNYVHAKHNVLPERTKRYGIFSGLKVWMKPTYNSPTLAGITVSIHDPSDIPGRAENKHYLSLNTLNYFHVYGSSRLCDASVKKMPIEQRQCLYPNERSLKFFDSYKDGNCFVLCEARAVLASCNCVPYYFDFIIDKTVCALPDLPCVEETLYNLQKHVCDCPPQCEDDIYDITLSSTKIMQDDLSVAGLNNTKNLVFANVFFSNNRQIIWLREALTTDIYLLSSFGGIYGLFLGCSIISFVEIIYYIAKCFCNRTKIETQPNKLPFLN